MDGTLGDAQAEATAGRGRDHFERVDDLSGWNALFAPSGTPPEIVKTLNQALRDILAEPDVKKRLLELGIEAKASTPEEISVRLKSDIDKWKTVIEKAGIPKQ